MTGAIPDVPEMVCQIYEDLEKEKTRCIVFQVQDKSIVIQLSNHGESCYATDEGRLPIFLVDVTTQQTCLCWANVGPTFVVTLDQRRTPTLDQRCFAHWAYGGPTVGANHLPTFSQC